MITFVFTSKIPKRPDTSKWKGVKDTREHMHSIMNTGENLKVNVRNVVCLCSGCLHGDSDCKYPEYVDKWRGFDMNKYEAIETSFQLWKSVAICKTVGSREDYAWEDVRAILRAFTDFDGLQDYVKRNPLPFFDCHINLDLSEQWQATLRPCSTALHSSRCTRRFSSLQNRNRWKLLPKNT